MCDASKAELWHFCDVAPFYPRIIGEKLCLWGCSEIHMRLIGQGIEIWAITNLQSVQESNKECWKIGLPLSHQLSRKPLSVNCGGLLYVRRESDRTDKCNFNFVICYGELA